MLKARLMGPDDLSGGGVEWNTLVEAMPFPSFFCTWEWIETWLEHFGSIHKPYIIGVYEGSQLRGVLPLAGRTVWLESGWKSGRILEFCGRELAPDHMDLVCAPHDARECLSAIAMYLKQEVGSWDVILLSSFSREAQVRGFFDEPFWKSTSSIQLASCAPVLSIEGFFEEYSKSVLRERGATIKRKSRRLGERGFAFSATARAEGGGTGLDVLFDLHALRMKSKGMLSSFAGARVRSFHRSLLEKISKRGWAFLRYLSDGERTIAAFYGFRYGNRLYYYQNGHDPAFDRFSPGAVLMYRVIEEAFELGLEEFDFLRGNEVYKSTWAPATRELFMAKIYNQTPLGQISRSSFEVRMFLKGVLGGIADQKAAQ